MKKLIIIAALAVSACSDSSGAERTLTQNGYSNVRTDGYAFFTCDDKSDTFATKFYATSPAGVAVSGAVCRGLLKGSTIRFD